MSNEYLCNPGWNNPASKYCTFLEKSLGWFVDYFSINMIDIWVIQKVHLLYAYKPPTCACIQYRINIPNISIHNILTRTDNQQVMLHTTVITVVSTQFLWIFPPFSRLGIAVAGAQTTGVPGLGWVDGIMFFSATERWGNGRMLKKSSFLGGFKKWQKKRETSFFNTLIVDS